MRSVLLLLLASPVFAQTVPWRDAPKLALDTRLSGTVVVEALVDSTGNVAAAGIARSNPALDDAAIARVRAMHFEPLVSHGHAVASLRQVPVAFEAPPGNGPADTWAAERCAEAKFTIERGRAERSRSRCPTRRGGTSGGSPCSRSSMTSSTTARWCVRRRGVSIAIRWAR